MIRLSLLLAAGILGVALNSDAYAEQKPLWEAGLGIGGLVFPDYRGSDETSAYPIPVPYFVYRGKFLRADGEGVRGRLFNREYAELSLSLNGTIPVSSEDNAARQGMPDLDPTFEIGPSLDIHLWKSADGNQALDLIMPLRMPITIESSPRALGWLFSPRLNVDLKNIQGSNWDVGFGAGPLFANQRYHDYFYSVAPRYATTTRAEYEASGGYSGAHAIASVSKRFPGYWVGAYIRYEALDGAAFDDSPLFKSSHYVAGGIGIAWMIGQSKQMVEATE
jgi:outer membrane scaffolding protein for murein synthesis (MipA/OmpV family)